MECNDCTDIMTVSIKNKQCDLNLNLLLSDSMFSKKSQWYFCPKKYRLIGRQPIILLFRIVTAGGFLKLIAQISTDFMNVPVIVYHYTYANSKTLS